MFMPGWRRKERRGGRVRLVTTAAGRASEAGAFRDLYRNLREGVPAGVRSIFFTSPGVRDGKTTIVCNLALTMAAAGERVLVIDANPYRPVLHAALFVNNDRGLTTLLEAPERLQENVQEIAMPRFDVLTSGPVPPSTPPAPDPVRLRAVVREAVNDYGTVLLDGPSVHESGDALVWAQSVGGVILVVREGAPEDDSREARRMLEAAGARILGVVLNRVREAGPVAGGTNDWLDALVSRLEAEQSSADR